mmetsp:Transcript_2496/g.5471  ORF Transcript_2496/g.5471 Transcript_2496/m.5471 type:complete len:860 (-) Transcript_2496:94-2673(-)
MKALQKACCCICGGESSNEGQLIKLNVGGHLFTTTRKTFASCPQDSVLPILLKDRPAYDGAYFLDRDGRHFRHILNFCRDGAEKFTVLESMDEKTCLELRREAEYLGITALIAKIDQAIAGPGAAAVETKAAEAPNNPDKESVEQFDHIAATVAGHIDTPIVMINLIDDGDQWCKAGFPHDMGECRDSLTETMCGLLPGLDPFSISMLIIEDARKDPRSANNKYVVGEPHCIFYAGVPLISASGSRLGSMCAVDNRSVKRLARADAQFMINMAQMVVRELERWQLEKDTSDVEHFDSGNFWSQGTVAPEASEFLQGPSRVRRMRESLEEVVALVRVNLDNMDWPVIFANVMWTVWTDTKILPPTKKGEVAQVKGAGLAQMESRAQLIKERGPMLKDWLEITGKNEATFLAELKQQLGQGQDSMFHAEGTVRTGFARVPVTCRFVPYSHPIDVTASGIKIPSASPWSNLNMSTTMSEARVDESNRLFFVIMKQRDATPWSRLHSDRDSAGTSAVSSGDYLREGHFGDRRISADMFASNGSARSASSARTASGLESPLSLKPPTPPFEDVKLLRMIGKGSFGKVYYGMWMGAAVAVKVLDTKGSASKSRDEPRFEASISASISHPHLVQTFKFSTRAKSNKDDAVCDEEGSCSFETWIVQEWCDLGTLGKNCKQPRLEIGKTWEVLDITREVCGAGAYLHSRGIIHGDLTANNVLVRSHISPKGYVCKLCDFGLARVLEGEESEIMTTQLGTVTHMPPELFQLDRQAAKLTPKADVYAAGVLMWQALMGKTPYSGLSPPQVVMQVASGKLLKLPADVPEDVQEVFKRTTHPDPDQRPDFDEVVDDLYELMEDYFPMAVLPG